MSDMESIPNPTADLLWQRLERMRRNRQMPLSMSVPAETWEKLKDHALALPHAPEGPLFDKVPVVLQAGPGEVQIAFEQK